MGLEHESGFFAQKWNRALLTIRAAAFLIAAPFVKPISAATVPCPNGGVDTLGPGVADSDLLVTGGTCKVKAGTYMYRNINITSGGVLVFDDAVIDLWAANIIIEDKGT